MEQHEGMSLEWSLGVLGLLVVVALSSWHT